MVVKKTEFGRGLTYCIGLFLKHAERYSPESKLSMLEDPKWVGLWFYAAADHLYDLSTSKIRPRKLKERVKSWRNRVLALRLPMHSERKAKYEDYEWAIHEAEEILCEIDENMLNVKTAKGCR